VRVQTASEWSCKNKRHKFFKERMMKTYNT
jgi:hypothetical protein